MFDKDSLPEKSLFKAEEVCRLVGIKPYILRFWESEFVEISPMVSSSGKKLYERKDLRIIAVIKKLLFEEKLTIEKVKATVRNLSESSINKRPKKAEVFEVERPIKLPVPQNEDREGIKGYLVAKASLEKILTVTKSIQKFNNWV